MKRAPIIKRPPGPLQPRDPSRGAMGITVRATASVMTFTCRHCKTSRNLLGRRRLNGQWVCAACTAAATSRQGGGE